jgi:hypothetical protein
VRGGVLISTEAIKKVATQILFVSPQIANPHIVWLIPQFQIRKFLSCSIPQIANPQICNFLGVPVRKFANLQGKKKQCFRSRSTFKIIFVKRKIMYLLIYGSFFVVSKNSWVRKLQKNMARPQICGFAELICGPPTFEKLTGGKWMLTNTASLQTLQRSWGTRTYNTSILPHTGICGAANQS